MKAAVGNFHDTAVNSHPAFAGELRAAKPLAPLAALSGRGAQLLPGEWAFAHPFL